MIKLIIVILFVLLSITILFFILTKNKQQMIQTYSLSTFLGLSSEDEMQEPNQSLIEKINDYFGNSVEETNDGDEDSGGGGDDAGE
ncbi:hypothetical protein V7111_24930 [Neobacillus niacini]|uniref:hypothetical protein n=1 Tax=Neobacillus niacini TaxID=86668 RepID=UPI0030039D22